MKIRKFNESNSSLESETSPPRGITQEELQKLYEYEIGMGRDEENAKDLVEFANHAVFDHYVSLPSMSYGGGYTGKLIISVHDRPEFSTTYIFDKDDNVAKSFKSV